MTLKRLIHELEHYFLAKSVDVDTDDVALIASLMQESNYMQILYQYKIDVLLHILHMLEDFSYFEECEKIVQTIKDTNKLEKKKYPTR